MSSSSDYSETVGLLGRKTIRLPEKSNFSQTCSLLSHYLKERGNFGSLMNMGVTCNLQGKGLAPEKPETCHQKVATMNLLPNLEVSSEESSISEGKVAANRNIQSMDLFPQQAGFVRHPSSVSTTEDVPKTANFKLAAAATSQMTIFYAGKVLVFDDFSAEKAREIMLLASNGSSQKLSSIASTSGNDQLNQSTFAVTSSSNLVTPSGNNQEHLDQLPPRPNVSDLPIARKASLHRFLEKRKDRISAKAPYPPVNNSSATSSSKQADNKMWLGLASEASTFKQLELQL
ncbi:hypothetical protein NE237_026195 [Protea cynaroides]|uniref:Protein TIFY n=1 Tax=Protea cynaroides TaxID=273540 RepID=A0A9Q0H4J3_9MAGN|nr:hypothetical protein NE237_026195 [Protea cynaroides]